jgi:hypothetical protein
MSTSENLISNFIELLCQFNYEKAKVIIVRVFLFCSLIILKIFKYIYFQKEKHREYKDYSKLWNSFQNALIQLVYTEKLYNNIQFLNQKSSTKV